MIGNWQHKTWPQFTYNQEILLDFERQFLEQAGILYGSMKHINHEDKDTFKIVLIRTGELKSTRYYLNIDHESIGNK